MCNACVHVMRRRGGVPLFLCVLCSHKCEPILMAPSKKKKGFRSLLDTVKLKFNHVLGREK